MNENNRCAASAPIQVVQGQAGNVDGLAGWLLCCFRHGYKSNQGYVVQFR